VVSGGLQSATLTDLRAPLKWCPADTLITEKKGPGKLFGAPFFGPPGLKTGLAAGEEVGQQMWTGWIPAIRIGRAFLFTYAFAKEPQRRYWPRLADTLIARLPAMGQWSPTELLPLSWRGMFCQRNRCSELPREESFNGPTDTGATLLPPGSPWMRRFQKCSTGLLRADAHTRQTAAGRL